MKDNVLKELKNKEPATFLWLFLIIIGFIVAGYGWVITSVIYLGFVGSAIIFSSMLPIKFQKQINSHFGRSVN